MTGQATNVCTLITASCTTGWLDAIHAELWFLWLRMDGGFEELREALSQRLGSRFST